MSTPPSSPPLRAARRSASSTAGPDATSWAVSAYAVGVAAGLAVGYAGHRPVGYAIAVLFGLLAVAQPLNERSFTRYLAQADDVPRDGPDFEHG